MRRRIISGTTNKAYRAYAKARATAGGARANKKEKFDASPFCTI